MGFLDSLKCVPHSFVKINMFEFSPSRKSCIRTKLLFFWVNFLLAIITVMATHVFIADLVDNFTTYRVTGYGVPIPSYKIKLIKGVPFHYRYGCESGLNIHNKKTTLFIGHRFYGDRKKHSISRLIVRDKRLSEVPYLPVFYLPKAKQSKLKIMLFLFNLFQVLPVFTCFGWMFLFLCSVSFQFSLVNRGNGREEERGGKGWYAREENIFSRLSAG
jgi:hypothetical protein